MGFIACTDIEDALNREEAYEWRNAIKYGIKALLANKTWKIVDKKNAHNIVSCKLVLQHKYKSNGELERRKARLVAKGYSQKPGTETFAPVVKRF